MTFLNPNINQTRGRPPVPATILLVMASAVFGFWVGAHRDRRAEEVALAGALLDELTTLQERFATYHRLIRGRESSAASEPIRLEMGLAGDRILWRAIALGWSPPRST